MENHADRRVGRSLAALALCVILCFGVAGLGGYWTSLGLGPWYDVLRKPRWTPPNWVFGPVWSALYTMMAVAAWRVWRARGSGQGGALALFGLQLALNLAWSGLFFGLRSPGAGVVAIAALWMAIAATLVAFRRLDRVAGMLMVPYLLWVTYASALNVAIWHLNA